MKKILIIGEPIDSMGGIQTFTNNIMEMFNEDSNISIDLLACGPISSKYESMEPFIIGPKFMKRQLHRVPFIKAKAIKEFLESKNYSYDCILLNYPKDIKALDKYEGKIILIQHQTFNTWISRFIYFNDNIKLINKVNKRVNVIVTLSPQEERKVLKKFSGPSIVVLRHTSKMKSILKKNKNNKIIMPARFINKHKRFDIAIDLLKNIPEYELHIYGDGKDKKKIKSMAKGYKNIYLHDRTNNLEQELKKYSFLLITSDYEGYPLAALESIKNGLVPLVRNTFLSAEDIVLDKKLLLDDDITSLELKDKLDYVLENMEEFQTKLRHKREDYDWEAIKCQWGNLFNNLK